MVLMKLNKYLKYLKYLYYIIMILLVNYIPYGSNLLVKLTTLDGLFGSFHLIMAYMNKKNLRDSHVLEAKPIYTRPTIDRYFYYIIKYLLYKFVCIFFWTSKINILYYGLMITAVPPILNRILKSKIYSKIRQRKKIIIKTILSKQLALLVKFTSKTYLNKNISIKHTELLPLFNDYDKTVSHLQTVIKNTVIALILAYIRQYPKVMMYKMLKYIYNYKTGNNVKSFEGPGGTVKAKYELSKMINDKSWSDLLNTKIYSAMLCLYQNNIGRVDIFGRLIRRIMNKSAKMGASHFIISFFFNSMLFVPLMLGFTNPIFIAIPLVSCIMYLKDPLNRVRNMDNILEYIMHGLSVFVGYQFNSPFLTSFICYFGSDIINNKITHTIAKYMCSEIKSITGKVVRKNYKYNKFLVTSLAHLTIYNYITKFNNIFDILPYISSIILIADDKNKVIIYTILLLVSRVAGFNLLHLISSLGITYIGIGYRDSIGKEFTQLYKIVKSNINNKIFYKIKPIIKKKIYPIGRMKYLYNYMYYGINMIKLKKLEFLTTKPLNFISTINTKKIMNTVKNYDLFSITNGTKVTDTTDKNEDTDPFRLSQEEFINEISASGDKTDNNSNPLHGSLHIVSNYIK